MTDVFLPGGPLDERRFSPASWAMMQQACQAAEVTRWETLRSPHVFMGVMATPDAAVTRWCDALATTPARMHRQFVRLFLLADCDFLRVRLHREFCSTNTINFLRSAAGLAADRGHGVVRPADLLGSLLTDDGCVSACFREGGYPAAALRRLLRETDAPGQNAPQSA